MWPGEILGYFKNGELSNSIIQGVRGIGGGLEITRLNATRLNTTLGLT